MNKKDIEDITLDATKKLEQLEKVYLIDTIAVEDEEEALKKWAVKVEFDIETLATLPENKEKYSNAAKRKFAVEEKLKQDVTFDLRSRELISKKTKLRYLEIEVKKQKGLLKAMDIITRGN
jgi:hypothetical protein